MSIIKTLIDNRLTKDEFYTWYNNSYRNVIDVKYDNLFNYMSSLPDINQAVNELIYALITKKVIILCVDIDHDGCASGVIGYKFLTTLFPTLTPKVRLIISSRKFKRGFNQDMIDKIESYVNKENVIPGLIITADMGSSDNQRYKLIKDTYKDIKIIVTDHHTVEEDNYPTYANAFINVQRDDFKLEKCICGCATLFFLLVSTYFKFYKIQDKDINLFKDYLPYVAAATIVDSMSMKYPINRYLVKLGLQYLNLYPDRNFSTIKKLLRLPNILRYKDIAMSIGPLINTGNRLSFEQLTLYSLTTEDDNKSLELMRKLSELSKIRKQMTNDVLQNTLNMNNIYEYKYVTVVKTISRINIAGVIANNILGMTNTPCICFLDNNSDILIGSARSIDGVNLLSIVRTLSDYIIEANGHEAAFGISIRKEKFEEFKQQLNIALQPVINNLPKSTLQAELMLSHEDLTIDTMSKIDMISPYGVDWKQPICSCVETFKIIDIFPIKNFYKLTFQLVNGLTITGMHFFKDNITSGIYSYNFMDIIKIGMRVKLFFYLTLSYYKEYSIGLEIIDIYPRHKE